MSRDIRLRRKHNPVYMVWSGMIARCYQKSHRSYRSYGAKGIVVCDRWLDFDNFVDDMGQTEKGMSLDRLDNSKGYYKENCRYLPRFENVKAGKIVEFGGERMNLSRWSERTGIGIDTLSVRLKTGWSVEDALTLKPRFWGSGGHKSA